MLMKNLTWKSSSHAGWWWCSVARTHVLRKTRVTMSQNIHWDLQMFRHFLRIDRFHLNRHNYLTFVTNSSIEMLIVQWQMLPLIVTFASGYGTSYTTFVCFFCYPICLTYFSKRFIRFSHGVCLICFLGFLVSSVTLAVTVTEIIILDTINYQLKFLQWKRMIDI